jgi:hypothetical protein
VRTRVRSLPFAAVAGVALGACEFSDSIEIGSHDVFAGAGGNGASGAGGTARSGAGGGGAGGAGGAGAVGGIGGVPSFPTAGANQSQCGVGTAPEVWVRPLESTVRLAPGIGGSVVPGEYQLTGLVKHGICPCFDANATLAQTLFLMHDGTGSVSSRYQHGGPDFVSRFTFSTQANRFALDATCVAPNPSSQAAPFGSFETFTAGGNTLFLMSAACSYRAEYRLMPRVPF